MSGANSITGSRWTAIPEGAERLDPFALPDGFAAGDALAGIKPGGAPDLGIVACLEEAPTSAIARKPMTRSSACAMVPSTWACSVSKCSSCRRSALSSPTISGFSQ